MIYNRCTLTSEYTEVQCINVAGNRTNTSNNLQCTSLEKKHGLPRFVDQQLYKNMRNLKTTTRFVKSLELISKGLILNGPLRELNKIVT